MEERLRSEEEYFGRKAQREKKADKKCLEEVERKQYSRRRGNKDDITFKYEDCHVTFTPDPFLRSFYLKNF
jgi:hypothetical protein